MRLFAALAALVALATIKGCGSGANEPRDMGQGQPDLPPRIDQGDGYDPVVRYRITELHIPTLVEATSGIRVGHNVDGTGDTCGVLDYPGGVDNAFIDLSSELATLEPPAARLDLQAAIDTALGCPADAEPSVCTRLDLIVSVASGTGRAIVEIEDSEGTSLAGPFAGILDGSGNLRSAAAGFSLAIPYQTADGSVAIYLHISSLLLTAYVSANTLTNLVLGGVIHGGDFEEVLVEVLPRLGDELTFEDVEPMLTNLYDVQISGQCSGLSVGFTGAAEALPPSAEGPP